MAERIQMVSDYMRSFQEALENQISLEEIGGTKRQYLAGEYIKKNKRDIVLFVTTGPPETSKHIIEITYKLPVGEDAAGAIFGEDEIMPSEGPTFFEYDVAVGTAIETMQENAQKPHRGLSSWPAEQARIQGALADMPAEKKRVARNILRYWRDMRTRIYDAVYAADVRLRRTTSGRTASSASVRSRRTSSHRTPSGSNPRSHKRTTGRSTSTDNPHSASRRTRSNRRT